MALTYQEEKFVDIYEEIIPTLEIHWEELAIHKDIRPVDVDVDKYTQLNEIGVLRILTVRDDGKLIGYGSFTIHNNLHYKTWVCAGCDVYYLTREYRKSGIGVEFFQQIKTWLQGYGVNSIVLATKKDHPHTIFFTRLLGFTEIEQNFELLI